MQKKNKAIIFDLDGTLLDTLQTLADVANQALEEADFTPHPVEAYRFFVGDGMENLIRRATPHHTGAKTLTRITGRMRDLYSKGWAQKTKPYAGIVSMLEKLTAAALPMAVLSNKPHELAQITVRHYFTHIPFTVVQGSPQKGTAKPDPALALGIADLWGIAPDQVLFMGDSGTDMDTAVAAGMVPAAVLWGFRPQSELEAHGARLLLKQPCDIFSHVKEDGDSTKGHASPKVLL